MRSGIEEHRKVITDFETDRSIYFKTSLVDVIFGIDSDKIDETGFTQPALFAFQYALTQLWKAWGIEPYAVMGHSVGEFAAAVTAGVLSLEDGLRLIASRATLMQALPKEGKMVAVLTDEAVVRDKVLPLAGRVSIAAYNGPSNVVISGNSTDVDQLVEHFQRSEIRCVELATSHAFHSHLMDPILAELDKVASQCVFNPPQLPMASNLRGTLADDDTFNDPNYWSQHARGSVQFKANFEALVGQGCNVFIEIGPQPVLIGMANRIHSDSTSVHWVPSVRRDMDDERSMLQAVGKLFCIGAELDFLTRGLQFDARRVDAPTYPFERRKYYGGITLLDRLRDGSSKSNNEQLHPLIGREIALPLEQRVFEQTISLKSLPRAFQHETDDAIFLSNAACLHTALECARRNAVGDNDFSIELNNVNFSRQLVVSDQPIRVQTLISQRDSNEFKASLLEWRENSSKSNNVQTIFETQVKAMSLEPIDHDLYELKELHADLIEEFRSKVSKRLLEQKTNRQSSVRIRFAIEVRVGSEYKDSSELECKVLESVFQELMARVTTSEPQFAWIASKMDRMRLVAPLQKAHRCVGEIVWDNNKAAVANLILEDDQNDLIAELAGVQLQAHRMDYLRRLTNPVPSKWLKNLGWQMSTLAPQQVTAKQIRILLIAGSQPHAEVISSALGERGASVASMLLTEDQAKFSAEFEKKLEAGVDLILHCGSISAASGLSETSIEESVQLGYGNLLGVVHQLLELRRNNTTRRSYPNRLMIVTCNAQSVPVSLADQPLEVSQSLTVGLGRVLVSEHPELNPSLLDIDSTTGDGLQQICDEVFAQSDEDQVAWRAQQRYVARLQDAKPLAEDFQAAEAPRGTALVTGGLGGLGLQLANTLALQGTRSILLVGRSKPTAEAEATMQRLRRQGIDIRNYTCDISINEQVTALVNYVDANMSGLDRIYHLAGVLDDGLIRDQDELRLKKVLASKALGALYLHEATKNLRISKFVLFSSVAAIAGSPGQCNYAAANAYLDALAHHRRSIGLPATSINWGSWADVGMAANLQAADHQRWAAAGVGWIDVQRGMWALESIVGEDRVQCAVMPMDWERFHNRWSGERVPSWLRGIAQTLATNEKVADAQRPELLEALNTLPAAEQFPKVLEHFTKLAARTLAWKADEPPNPMRTLNELGFDSLTGVEFCNAVGKSVGVKLAPTVLFDYPSIRALSEHVAYDVLKLASETPAKSEDASPLAGSQQAKESTPAAPEIDLEAFNAVEAMSEAELEALINGQLAFLDGV